MPIAIAAVNLALAVIIGAFGAHGLKHIASAQQLAWWHTATEYFFFHALGLLALGILAKVASHIKIIVPFTLIQLGILFFCGSLYIMGLGLSSSLGIITPIGGLLMILGWLSLAWLAYQQRGSFHG